MLAGVCQDCKDSAECCCPAAPTSGATSEGDFPQLGAKLDLQITNGVNYELRYVCGWGSSVVHALVAQSEWCRFDSWRTFGALYDMWLALFFAFFDMSLAVM